MVEAGDAEDVGAHLSVLKTHAKSPYIWPQTHIDYSGDDPPAASERQLWRAGLSPQWLCPFPKGLSSHRDGAGKYKIDPFFRDSEGTSFQSGLPAVASAQARR
jgi:hypothetical protein